MSEARPYTKQQQLFPTGVPEETEKKSPYWKKKDKPRTSWAKTTATCRECGITMEGVASQRRYCSTHCRNKAAGKRAMLREGEQICQICGNTFMPSTYGSKTCSRTCRGEAISRGKLGRKNPNWKGGRGALRKPWDAAIKSSCEICQGTDLLRNHHIVYAQHVRKLGGDEWDPRNGMTLCMSCHSRHHNGTDFRIIVCDLPDEFFEFGDELLGEALWDYLARHYDTGLGSLAGLVSNAP